MGRTKNKPTKRNCNINCNESGITGRAEQQQATDLDHCFIRQRNIEHGTISQRTEDDNGNVDVQCDYDSLVDSDSSDNDNNDNGNGNGVAKQRSATLRLKKVKDRRRNQVQEEGTSNNGVGGSSHASTQSSTANGLTSNGTTNNNAGTRAENGAEEEKKEEKDDDDVQAKKPLPEIEFVKCRRKKCKTILRFLSPNVFTNSAASASDSQDTRGRGKDTSTAHVPAHLGLEVQEHGCVKEQPRVVRTYILYETSTDLPSLESSTDANMRTSTYMIHSPTAALQILNYYSKKDKQRRGKGTTTTTAQQSQSQSQARSATKKMNWDPLILALDHDLVRMELQQCTCTHRAITSSPNNTGKQSNGNGGTSSTGGGTPTPMRRGGEHQDSHETDAVVIRIILTKEAYNQCSPYNLSRNVPLKQRKTSHNRSKQKMDGKALACILQEALGSLWQGSILDDLLPISSLNQSNGKNKKGREVGGSRTQRGQDSNDITAKMVYKAVDNVHSHLFEVDDDGGDEEKRRSDLGPKQRNGGITCSVPAAAASISVSAASSIVPSSNGIHGGLSQDLSQPLEQVQGPGSESGEKNLERTGTYLPKQSNIPGLVPKLRKYQKAAVAWMLQRERGEYEDRGWEICWIVILDTHCGADGVINDPPDSASSFDDIMMPLYRYQQAQDSGLYKNVSCIFYNPFSGWLANNYEIAKVSTIGNGEAVKGGILAESMGLGKTVEVLACILSNPCVSVGNPVSDDKNCFEDKESNEEPSQSEDCAAATGSELQVDEHDFICFCGKGGHNTSSLSWVLCINCNEPMHGQCAGFVGEQDLIMNSRTVPGSHKDRASFRLCNAKRCPTCVTTKHALAKNLIQSRATLIVTPPSILAQWEREIKRHTLVNDTSDKRNPVRALRVKVYHGVQNLCNLTHTKAKEGFQRRLLHAHYLADVDIVLTTFQALMNDLGHSNDNPYIIPEGASSRRTSRKRKRYRVVPSPLMSIKWWRICLDEAQRVETPTAASARMALKLVSHHRWCVSGTPAGRGKMNDLYGLLLFLNTKPFCEKDWFLSSIKAEYRDVLERIAHMLQDTLWRSTKSNSTVRIQMGIPEQFEKKVYLSFSSIERHFYQRQLEETILAADSIIGEKGSYNRKRKAKDAVMLSNQLHRLRAACCHPQVGVGGIGNLKRQNNYSGTSVATGVLSMSQILDRLIDDAKVKAEEAQRLYTLNTNAIACLCRLKAESGSRGGTLIDSDDEINLLQKSSKAYMDAIDVADNNSSPSSIVGEAVLTGCNGFQTPGAVVRDGAAAITWIMQTDDDDSANPEVWTRFDFNGATKKITSLAVRPLLAGGDITSTDCSTLFPRECVLQVSNAAIGGMFVDTLSFTLARPDSLLATQGGYEWQQFHGYRPHKSKSWRVYVKNYHDEVRENNMYARAQKSRVFVGFEIQLLEPDVLPDSLQRLHILHNGSLTLASLQSRSKEENITIDKYGGRLTSDTLQDTITKMRKERESLESHYIEAARVLQMTSQVRLEEVTKKRKELLDELSNLGYSTSTLQESWWNDLVAWCHLDRKVQSSLFENVEQSLFELFNDPSQPFNRRTFPVTDTLDGLHIALSIRLQENTFFPALATNTADHEVFRCIQSITDLSDHPSERDIFENSHCHKCRSDWDQKGPKCKCCKLEEELLEHQNAINGAEINCILRSMSEWVKQNADMKIRGHSGLLNLRNLSKKAEKFFGAQDIVRKELDNAKSKWRTHLDLLSDIDELNQCKRTMRLCFEGEDLFGLTAHEQAFIVQPRDIPALIMDHTAKQAMAEGHLRRTKELLRFLKNQNLERKQSVQGDNEDHNNTCCICLCAFGENDRAVLRCGHTYHYSPCLEQLFTRSGNQTISCPMRCAIRTKKEDILIASDIRKDDGSKTHRAIQGSWGTKVDRLISDLLEVVEVGEKSIVFSQWDDMLHILEIALQTNSILYVRPKSIKKFGDSMNYFRTSKCHVLLLHVKHGAEGLTLVEANHVFMIEPLLNHSMDSQAINRIHRIGQMSKTFIHRYIIEDTIEVKIDKLRAERQSHDGEEEEMSDNKNSEILRAGGLDGGFNKIELEELLK